MQRRDFIKTSILGTGILMGSNIMNANPAKTKKYNLTFEYQINFASASDTKIWIPMPMTTSFQKPSNVKIQGNYDFYKTYTQSQTPIIYAQYSKKPKRILASVDILIVQDNSKEKSNHLENYLKPTRYIRTDGMIEQIAKELSLGNEQEKLVNIYKWIKKNIDYENAKDTSKIRTILSKNSTPILSGENISANTIFVSLCRACGIPAREAIGINIKTLTTLSKAQAYINDSGWNLYDPIASIKDSSFDGFGKWKDDFIFLNYERDMKIESSIVSLFDNAFATVDGDKLKYYENKNFTKNINIKTLI
ncbi:transglutaminase-like domain-containing protein [Helicobacter cappadocius]|uniref:Transglutaminase-like domain-containing protein n=1 Tax=Helicobacter cappadocius TaxID=3063998 RepID=A0AA90PHS5_9HELI|nr:MULTISPECIES: transglutaminase-like domain-containing protein [unclassified Helicobacter]MDO7252650.1 transglutaminase-like domain-containing protein [Helicobacter sp. faydin-H75]MDP2538517.1 transglutaminase-like domain-containing protein [Helicobacter sp. faydin-H76]